MRHSEGTSALHEERESFMDVEAKAASSEHRPQPMPRQRAIWPALLAGALLAGAVLISVHAAGAAAPVAVGRSPASSLAEVHGSKASSGDDLDDLDAQLAELDDVLASADDDGEEDAADDSEEDGDDKDSAKEDDGAAKAHDDKGGKGASAAGDSKPNKGGKAGNSSAAFCCYSAASGLPRTPKFCATCYSSAAAGGNDFCSESYENCATCGAQATWCHKGAQKDDFNKMTVGVRTKQCNAVHAKIAKVEDSKPKESLTYYKVPPIPEEKCSTSADNCKDSKCCSQSGFQCFKKDKDWATCRESCHDGVAPGWWCDILSNPDTSAVELAKAPKEPSFFCWSIIRNSGFEPLVLREQYKQCAGIFGCEAWAVFSKAPVALSDGPPKVTTSLLPSTLQFAPKKRGGLGKFATPSWVNTDNFLAAWDMIGTSAVFEKHDWTIKADPDAVFIPARLQRHLHDHGGVDDIYLTNCKGVRHALYGSLEIVSKGAVRTLVAGLGRCTKELEYGGWGEDLFLQMCLDLNGVHHVDDFFLVSDGCCNHDVGQDGVCQHEKPCISGEMAFHPFKDAKAWMECWDAATR